MINNKGFTVVELLASFSLTMVIVVFLFEILLEIKDLYYEAGIKTEIIQSQSLLVKNVRNTLDTNELAGVDCSGDTCTLKFTDNDSMALTIDSNSNTIIFGEDKYDFPDDVKFSKYGITTCDIKDGVPDNDLGLLVGSNIKNCYLKLNVTISSPSLEKDYPINIVYPYVYDSNFINGNFAEESDKVESDTWFVYNESENKYKYEYTVLETGTYKIELLGASGGASSDGKIKGGEGAYTSGEIYLTKDDKLYFYVGCAGSKIEGEETASNTGGCNGGGDGSSEMVGSGGGGATDVRFGTEDLNSRIMVAAGGSGAGTGEAGKPGGGLIASNSGNIKGATQTSGGKGGNTIGTFGNGGAASDSLGSGGGGGYYGGAGGIDSNGVGIPGTGGSSFISGHFGSNAVNSSGNHTGQSVHHSNKVFYNTEIYSGDKVPTSKTANSFASSKGIENNGDGYAIITYKSSYAPSEALKLASSNASYPAGKTLWLDGYDNAGSGLHNYTVDTWNDLSGSHHMDLDNGKWNKDGLDLSTSGNVTMNINKGYTISTTLTLNEYPTETKKLIKGAPEISIGPNGEVAFNNVSLEYKIKLNLKECLTFAVTGDKVILYANGTKTDEVELENESQNTTLELSGELEGTLHKIMIFTSSLDAESIDSIYREDFERFGSTNSIRENLRLEYNFYDEYDGEIAIDSSGGGNNGTIKGDNNFDSTNKGIILKENDYLEIPGDINYRYTISLIVSSSDISGTPSLFGNSTYPEVYLNADNKYTFKAQGIDTSFAQTFQTNKKEYITLTYDGNNIDLYVDGSKKGTLATTTDPESVASAFIGKTFKGNLYKYAVYDRVLLDEEIIALYEYDYSSFK